jgi:hypothetical protein
MRVYFLTAERAVPEQLLLIMVHHAGKYGNMEYGNMECRFAVGLCVKYI